MGHTDVTQSKERSAEEWRILSGTLYGVLDQFRALNV
jgi:hypothetical protein